MTGPCRVQLRRSRGWRMPAHTRKVDRSTRWGNPFRSEDAAQSVQAFRDWLEHSAEGLALQDEARAVLRGWDLACWCAAGQPCHADVWLALVND